MSYIYNFDTCARVLEFAEPITYNGSWEVIKGGLIESGEIAESAGVVQKVVSIQTAATETATAGETASALCAMEVTEAEVAGGVVTTLTPKAAVAFTPKTVALCAIAGAIGLDLGYRVGQNLVNLYYGDDWDWDAPGIFDAATGLIRTYINKDGSTYYDEETVCSITNRLNEIGAFSESFKPEHLVKGKKISFINNLYYNPADPLLVGVKNINIAIEKCIKELITLFNLDNDFYKRTPTYVTILHGRSYGKDYISIGLGTAFLKDDTSVEYLYDYDMYISSDTKNDDLIDFNNRLISNLGNALNPTKGVGIYIAVQSKPSNKVLTTAHYSTDTTNMGDTWGPPNGPSGSGGYSFLYRYNKNSKAHAYFPLGTLEGMQGISKQQDAVIPSTFPIDIPATYPAWSAETLTNPDSDTNIYPVQMPDTNPDADLATRPQSDAQTGINENPADNKDIEDAIAKSPQVAEDLGLNPNPSSPTDDIGDLPISPIPAVGIPGTGFVAIYNPTQSQLASFSQYLWSSDFIDNIKKLFEDPMQAIIGLHMIYATPSRGADHNIICGYLDSGVNSRTVSSQYINIACGAIKINKYFGNILDYAPYTKIQLFLPFIGVVNLDTNEVMDSNLNITYRVDVLTGACLAQIYVSRSDYGAVMYTFSGNCAVQLPITGGNYSSIIANTIGIGASIGATIASGGALAPVLVAGAAAGVSNSHLSVAHSGSIGSNAGAMGGKIPYLIITRPKPYSANNYNSFYGYPSNETVKLSSCTGYTRVKDIHLENISSATDDELNEIESLLKDGVII